MVAVCVPWRPGDVHRNAAWEHVRAFWSDRYPVYTGDTDGPFNRAAARNAAAALTDAEILIFADADTIGDHQSISLAVAHAAKTGELTYPHTRTVKLSRQGTVQLRAGHRVKGQLIHGSPAGILVVRRDLYEQVMWDERFDEGWGYEDVAFAMAARTLGGVHRIPADIIHLWHPVAVEKRDAIRYRTGNRALRDEYGKADGDPKAMKRLLGLR